MPRLCILLLLLLLPHRTKKSLSSEQKEISEEEKGPGEHLEISHMTTQFEASYRSGQPCKELFLQNLTTSLGKKLTA